MRVERERVARRYGLAVRAAGISDLVELPEDPAHDEVHAWHLYPIRLHLDRLSIGRAAVIDRLGEAGVGSSVHFIPLHMHPYYRRTYGYEAPDLPVAAREYEREISLPIFPDLGDDEVDYIVERLAAILTSP
jgi:perosamine synthetase